MVPGIPEGGFIDGGDLTAWLDTLPEVDRVPFAQIIAHRAAMRVLPFAARAFSAKFTNTDTSFDLTLAVFRANAISRIVLKYPTRKMGVAATAAEVALAATRASSSNAAASAALAAASRASSINTAAAAANAAVANAAAAARVDIWNSVSVDVKGLIEEGGDAVIDIPLWLGSEPGWWRDERDSMRQCLQALDDRKNGGLGSGEWRVWSDWYVARSGGEAPWGLPEATAEKLELRIARRDGRDDFWGSRGSRRTPEAINAEISGWVEAAQAVIRLANIQIERPGNNWRERGNFLEIGNKVVAGDLDVARNPTTQRAHQSLLRKALNFGDAARGFDELYGWTGFGDDYNRLTKALECEGDGLAEHIWDIYDATLTVASYLQQDNDIRGSSPAFSNAALSASHRREFIDLVRSLAPWVRRFPTAQQDDENASNFLQRVSEQLTSSLLESAHQQGVITDEDRELIRALLAAMERNGLPAEKAGIRAHFSVRNLAFAGAMFLAGSVATGSLEKSELHGKITDWMAERIDEITEIIADAPDDIQVIIKDILADIASREGNDIPEMPPLPDGGSSRRRGRS